MTIEMTTCIDILVKVVRLLRINKRVVVFVRAQKSFIVIKLGLKISFILIELLQIKSGVYRG